MSVRGVLHGLGGSWGVGPPPPLCPEGRVIPIPMSGPGPDGPSLRPWVNVRGEDPWGTGDGSAHPSVETRVVSGSRGGTRGGFSGGPLRPLHPRRPWCRDLRRNSRDATW